MTSPSSASPTLHHGDLQRAAAERRQRRRRRLRRLALGLLGLGIVAALVVAWLPKPLPVDVGAAAPTTLQVTVDEDGRTRVREKYVVPAPLSGTLARIELHPGDEVKARSVLARLLPLASPLLDARSRADAEARLGAAQALQKQARATVGRAKLALEFAQREAARLHTLAAQGAATAQGQERAQLEERSRIEELASAEFGAQVAAHQVEQAQVVLAHLRGERPGRGEEILVHAPTAGRVLRVLHENEGPIQAGAPILELGDPSQLEIVVDVLTADAIHIAPGAKVVIDRWGGATPLAGHVRLIEPAAFTRLSSLGVEEQRVNVLIDLDDPRPRWAALGDGFRVEARITIWEGQGVLAVPAGALFRRGDEWAVFVVEGGRARLRVVETGRRNGRQVEIRRGLSAGTEVILHPSDKLVDGGLVVRR